VVEPIAEIALDERLPRAVTRAERPRHVIPRRDLGHDHAQPARGRGGPQRSGDRRLPDAALPGDDEQRLRQKGLDGQIDDPIGVDHPSRRWSTAYTRRQDADVALTMSLSPSFPQGAPTLAEVLLQRTFAKPPEPFVDGELTKALASAGPAAVVSIQPPDASGSASADSQHGEPHGDAPATDASAPSSDGGGTGRSVDVRA
jgi:hypothetical protein